jgi:branched-chain amino acid transport system permease protein
VTHISHVGLRLRTWSSSLTFTCAAALLAAICVNAVASTYWTTVAIGVTIFMVLGLGLTVVLGYAGLVDVGYAAFYAIGAYTGAIMTVKFGANFFVAVPVAIAVTAISGIIIGYPTLRLRPDYLAIVTIGFGEITRTAFNNWDYVNGPRGIYPLPVPELFGTNFLTPEKELLLTAAFLAVALAIVNRLGVSHIGRAWRAIRDDDLAADCVGVPTLRLKIGAYIIGGAVGAVAGVMFTSRSVAIDPSSFTITVSIQVLMIAVVGGLGSVRGVLLGATIFIVMPEVLRSIQDYRILVFSVLVILIARLRPQGLIPERRSPDAASMPSLAERDVGVPAHLNGRSALEDASPASAKRDQPGELLEVRDVTKVFGGLTAVGGVSFDVKRGELLGLIGPNGAGKTCMVNVITGVYPPTSGTVTMSGTRISGRRPSAVSRLGVARTFQAIRLFPQLSVIDNVMTGRHAVGESNIGTALLRPRRERRGQAAELEHALDLLGFVGLADSAMRLPEELPYAHRRRVEIARALATDPELLVLDEPAAGMNPSEKRELVTLLRTILDSGISVLMVEHDMPLVLDTAHRVVVLDRGTIIGEGDPREVLSSERVIEAYLGEAYVDPAAGAQGGVLDHA